MLAEGTTFAAYEVGHRLAVGGMGEVYLCRHRMLDRLDAVKVLRPHLVADEDFRRRFLREALSAARLRHPNVVTVYTADEWQGLLYLAMEYVAGIDLGQLLSGARLEPTRAVRLLGVVADALDAAHRTMLVHRDIKPSNLLVTDVGTARESVMLVDFGISRRFDVDSEITRTGEIVGTVAYCAPEQLTQRSVDGTCDQYGLACVAFECLTGQIPFPREGQLAMMTAHLMMPPPRATAVRPGLPTAVDAVFARALAKDPAQRYPTCAAFVAALSTAVARAPRDHPVFTEPAVLAEAVRSGHGVVLPAGHVDTLALRLGWPSGAAPHPLVVPMMAGPLAVCAGPAAAAACVRWLIAQTVARHRDRDVCLAAAVAPDGDENWLWLNWLPHARPSNLPLRGPHVATTREAAADLVFRLREVLAARREGGTGPEPRVLAVLDSGLGVSADDPAWVDAARYGVHLVHLLRPGSPAPPQVSTLDLSDDLKACRYGRLGFPIADGVPDAVSTAYIRALADDLPDDS